MTKQVQDKDGNISIVPDDTPCHAGSNGGLPCLYTKEEAVAIEDQQAIDSAAWQEGKTKRESMVMISRLEGQVTQRRIRDAISGSDNGWLVAQEVLIATERSKL